MKNRAGLLSTKFDVFVRTFLFLGVLGFSAQVALAQNSTYILPADQLDSLSKAAFGFSSIPDLTAEEVVRQCAMQSAHCGVIRDKYGRTVDCGEPLEGEFCAGNRSEPMCELNQLDSGKLDNLFAYVPLQFTDEDLSSNRFPVKTTMFPVTTPADFPFISRTDIGGKQLELDLGPRALLPSMTVSFKFIPNETAQSEVIFESAAMQIEQQSSAVKASFGKSNDSLVIENEADLKAHSCNHYAVVVDGNSIKAWLNGNASTIQSNTSGLESITGSLAIGPYPGRVWDVRIFEQALSGEEVAELGEDCADEYVMASPYPESTNYLCGIYSCIWWPEGTTDTSQESFEYQVEAHNMTYEHNIIAGLLYDQGDFCEGHVEKHANIHLTEGYRKRWVSKLNFSNPAGTYWLHENYHAYQGNVSRIPGKWFAESSAEWAAYTLRPGDDPSNSLLGYYTLQPHQPLWAREIVPEEWTAFSRYSGGHMYGSGIYMYYLSANYLGPKVAGDIIRYTNSGKADYPAEAMYRMLADAGFDMRDVFGEFAAKTITWDYPYYGESFKLAEDRSRRRMTRVRNGNENPWPEEDIDNKITAVYTAEGTGGNFVSVPDRYLPGSWAYNAYQVNVETRQNYRVAIKTSEANVDFAEFRATVVIHDEVSEERKYYPIEVAEPGDLAAVNVPAEAGNKLYLVVATTPSQDFSSYTMYRYEYLIEPTDNGGNPIDPPEESHIFPAGELAPSSNTEVVDGIPGYTGAGFVYLRRGHGVARWVDREITPGKYRITIYYQGTANNGEASSGRLRLRANGEVVGEFRHVPLLGDREQGVAEYEVEIPEFTTAVALVRKSSGEYLIDRFELSLIEPGDTGLTDPPADPIDPPPAPSDPGETSHAFPADQLAPSSNAGIVDDIPGYTGAGFVYLRRGHGVARWLDQEIMPGKYRITIYYQGTVNNAGMSSGRLRLRANGEVIADFRHIPLLGDQQQGVVEYEFELPELTRSVALIRKSSGEYLIDRFELTLIEGGSTGPNTPPVANSVSTQTSASESRDILLSASDNDGDSLSYRVIRPPANGELTGMAPQLTYRPNQGFIGTDSFTFRASDGSSDSNLATVTIRVIQLSSGKAKVFLMAGQSNMVGHGQVAGLSEFAPPSLLETRDDVFVKSIIESGRSLGPLGVGYGYSRNHYGVELKLGHVLGDVLSEDIYLFKAARGGTTLDKVEDWRPPAHGGIAGNLYDQMMQGFVSFQQAELAGIDYEIAGFIWFQGWNDAVPDRAGNYEGHLRNLLSSVRSDLDLDDLPVIIVQMNDGRGESSDIVMAAQAALAEESEHNSLVYTADQRPYFHYGHRSYIVIGDRIAQAALPILGMPASVPDTYQVSPGAELNTGAGQGVLANDVGGAITAELVQGVSHGILTLHSDGSFSYKPESDFKGQDNFVYSTVANGVVSNPVEVQLLVRDDNDPLVVHFGFDGESSEALRDEALGFNASVFKDGVSFGHPGVFGNAARFDGNGVLHYSEDYPTPEPLDLSTQQDFGITMWIKTEPGAGEGMEEERILITNKYSFKRGPGFSISTNKDGTGINVYASTGGVSKRPATQNIAINDGNWHHIAVSFEFSANNVSIYVDGNLAAETDTSGLSGDLNQYEPAIGNGSSTGNNKSKGFVGDIDDLRIYRSALTPEFIQEIMNTQ